MNNKYYVLLASILLLCGACGSQPPATQPPAAEAQIPVTGSTPGNASEAPITASRTPAPTIKALVSASTTCFELLTPGSNAQIPAIGKIDFTWQAMPDAARYLLEITMPNGSTSAFKTIDTKISRYAESTSMGGTYQWKVTAYNASDESLCTAGPSSYVKPEYSKPARQQQQQEPQQQQCPAPQGCTIWDPVACVCNG